jgi:hypothetical protein
VISRPDSAPATCSDLDELARSALRAEVYGAAPSAGVRAAVLAAAASGEQASHAGLPSGRSCRPQASPHHSLAAQSAAGSLAAYMIEAYLPWLRITA